MKVKSLILIFSLIGFSFSLYLYLNKSNLSFCSTPNSCSKVLNSKFTKTLGIDNSFLGIFYFLTVGVLILLNKEKFLKFLKIYSIFAAIFAFYLIFVMFFILKSICYYCLIVDLTAIIIFILFILNIIFLFFLLFLFENLFL